MDCNKDEAIRAKELAQKKMQNNDFGAAQRIALKAQQLFPELENISHLLAVCHVHCSAECRVSGPERDWYRILQVERLADEVTIKKQYRKLALLLHPDKNKFPGAEAAFKLIGEAHLVLSDRGKRSLYDGKSGISFRSAQAKPPGPPPQAKPPPHQVNKNPSIQKQSGVQNNVRNGFSTQFSGLNQHKTTQSDSSVGQESFWTGCPFCGIKYQYYRNFVNRALKCQNCSKPFIAYDIAAQGVPTGIMKNHGATQSVPPTSNWSQPSRQNEVPISGAHKIGTQKQAGFPASSSGSQWTASSRTMRPDSGSQMRGCAEVGPDLETQKTSNSMSGGMEGVATSKVDSVKPTKESNLGNYKRKRGSKLESESSENCETSSSSDSEDEIIKDSVSTAAAGPNSGVNGFREPRRSSRQKHNISYHESEGDDDDLESPMKRFRNSKSSSGSEGQKEDIFDADPHSANPLKQKESASSKVNSPEKKFQGGKNQKQDANALNDHEKVEVIDDDSETDAKSMDDPDQVAYDYPDPEFNDFDKDREESCFAVDQCWACFDPVDGMPRFYAHIRKVNSGEFKLRITWLEPDPDEESEIDWVYRELPASCGKFTRGKPEDTSDRLSFSHQMLCEKGGKKGYFIIYPRKGEIWAIFKDWNINWSTDLENHKKFKYEIVEILSDFLEGAGIGVAFLEKVRGFVSLFHRRNESRSESILVPPNELFRFSHKIPSFRMKGTEKEGVPEGCFELDPASLPLNADDICYPFMGKDDAENMGAEANCVFQKSSPIKSKLGTSENKSTPRKSDLFKGKNGFEGEVCIPRRSPRGLNATDKENNQVNPSPLSTRKQTANHLNSREGKDSGGFSPSKIGLSRQFEEFNSQMNESSPRISNSIPSLSPSQYVSKDLFYDFEGDRSEEKFQENQIWALYEPDSRLPKIYGQIRKIQYAPCMLRVALFEGCSPPKNGIQPPCGSFKRESGRPKIFSPNSFSHMLEAEITDKRLEIYPKEGQIWAMYKDWNPELSSSDLENCRYEIVEIIGRRACCTKVSSLVPLKGHNSVFRSLRKNRSSIRDIEVLENELARFSHQIPAFKFPTEKVGSLTGCWQLDPASVPSNVFPVI